MPEKYDEYEAAEKLNAIAEKLKEVDRLLQSAYRHFTPDVIELIDRADPKNEMDPGYWSKQIKMVADAVLEERLRKDDAAFEAEKKAPSASRSYSFGGPSF
ncbi:MULTISPECIES: hypothetical protein [Hyphomicrobiales]|uniref:hypothetical protein n=1 Tax=Hyphomicrobiales TaxID=356 RepID=UPI002119C8AE|nr:MULTISPECIES: hypothetical protein [Hyphomicrobiales]MCQ9147341.1 hypothetical protein [Ochrobactrum sp. BTU2]MDH1270341.1 hypothetical protein [Agrobacterium pusense]MDX4076590.1 hypothetical protein [Brucella sp. NBRC 113783]